MLSQAHSRDDSRTRPAHRLLAGIAFSVMLSACGADRIVTNAGRDPSDYRDRHPIVITDKNCTLDIFVGANSGPLDPRQRQDLRAFVQEFRQHGKGAMVAYVPVGSTDPVGDARGIEAIRAALSSRAITFRSRSNRTWSRIHCSRHPSG